MRASRMEYVAVPGSDLRVSRLALGTWLFGGRRWGVVDERETERTLEFALDVGISLFDTADAYGDGHAEALLGRALKKRRRDVVVATKVGVVWRSDGSRYVDLSPAHIRRAVRDSLKRLQTDVIDLYQLHEMDPATPVEETAEVLRDLQREGLIRHIGVSNFDVATMAALRALVPVVTTQSEYSLIKRSIEADILPYCVEHGLGVLAYSPLCRGLLSAKFTHASAFPETDNRRDDEEFQGDRFARNLERAARLHDMAREAGCSAASLALRWLLDVRGVTAVVCGARTPAQLAENVAAVNCRQRADMAARLSGLFSA